MVRITTGKPVSANVLTPTHSHERAHRKAHTQTHRHRDGTLLEAHGLSMKQRQPPESMENPPKEIEEKGYGHSPATLHPQQNVIPMLVTRPSMRKQEQHFV